MTGGNKLSEHLFVIAWAFQVNPEHQRDFEQAYGPNGVWERLFRTGDGYLRTELHRYPKKPGRYITLDFWRSREQYESFKDGAKTAYLEIDARCERLTEEERMLGEFEDLKSVRTALPDFDGTTLVRADLVFRPATPRDIPAILQIERGAESAAHWPEAAYANSLGEGEPTRIVLVAEDSNKQICGFVIARLVAEECELENIVVASRDTRQGIGSRLLKSMIDSACARGCSRIFLEVRDSNHAARAFYEKLGFIRAGERPSYYSDPVESAIPYSRTL